MDEAQKHGFVCKAEHIEAIYGHGDFCAYAARDYRGKKEGNILWRIFPEKEQDSADESSTDAGEEDHAECGDCCECKRDDEDSCEGCDAYALDPYENGEM
jgi:hypothetical protein